MAEDGRMTAAQAVDKLMGSEHADVIRESVRFMVDALMEAEVSAMIGAEFGERAPQRAAQRLSRSRVGHAGGRDRARDPEAALGSGVLPELLGAAPAGRAGAGGGCPGGLCQRH